VKLFGARPVPSSRTGAPGTVLAAGRDDGADGGLVVACATGAVRILQVQPAGKKRMSGEDWVRGRGIAVGDRFE
jgi:methionyl-tRNA formyltransferase